MNGSRILISLLTKDNDYQRAQAAAAEQIARSSGAQIEIVYAGNDAVNQAQQILNAIQKKDHGLAAVITEPVGTGMVQVAEQATKAGISWGVLNREIDYAGRLQRSSGLQVFEVSVDQIAVGQIHLAQLQKLVPGGGSVLYIEGSYSHSAARLRNQSMVSGKPQNIELKSLKGSWTEDSGYKAVNAWLKLSTAKSHGFVAIVSQNDAMALGARRAFSEMTDLTERIQWLSLPMLGCDGLPETGQQYVRRGNLVATAVCPLVAGAALDMYLKARSSGTLLPERTLIPPTSFPALEALRPVTAMAHGAVGS